MVIKPSVVVVLDYYAALDVQDRAMATGWRLRHLCPADRELSMVAEDGALLLVLW